MADSVSTSAPKTTKNPPSAVRIRREERSGLGSNQSAIPVTMKQSPVLKTMGTLPEMNPTMACEWRIQPHTVNAPCATIARQINASDPCLIRLADPSRGILRITRHPRGSREELGGGIAYQAARAWIGDVREVAFFGILDTTFGIAAHHVCSSASVH